MWSNGREHEDDPGQRVLYASSANWTDWTEPKLLFPSLVSKEGAEAILTAAGFHQYGGALVAYAGCYELDRSKTRLLAQTTDDATHWHSLRDLGVPVNPNYGPQPTASGRLVIAGNFAFPFTDDPTGLTGWQMSGLYPSELDGVPDNPWSFWRIAKMHDWPVALCEGSFFQTDDGVLHMALRSTGPGFRGRLWLTESLDDARTWSPPQPTAFSDNNSKFHFGRLPDKRFYYVGCPDPEPRGRRCPLVLSFSHDGMIFDDHYTIADEPYAMARPGRHKSGEYGYPHTLIHGDHLYVIVSRQKEAVQVIRVPLKQVK